MSEATQLLKDFNFTPPGKPPQSFNDIWRLPLESFAEVSSGGMWIPYRHLEYIAEMVQCELAGGGARIIVNMPPRHGKSLELSTWLPTHFLQFNPHKHVILTSYAADKARDWGSKVRDEFRSNSLVNLDGALKINPDRSAGGHWEFLGHGGGMISTGIRGQITGRGADLFICDDPHKDWDESHSPKKLDKLYKCWDSVIEYRLEPGASIIVVMTRWSDADLTAYLLSEYADEDWLNIVLPGICESEDDPLGRAIGEALCPERYTAEVLQKKINRNRIVGEGLIQQRPSGLHGNLIDPEWFGVWTTIPDGCTWSQSWDMSFKDTVAGSYVVGQVWAHKGADRYLFHQVRRRMDINKTIQAMLKMTKTFSQTKKARKFVEDKANGPAVISLLRSHISGLIPIEPLGSKTTRLIACAPEIESGNVYLPAPGVATFNVKAYKDELSRFPNAGSDDQVDATTQFLIKVKGSGAPLFGSLFEEKRSSRGSYGFLGRG